MRPARGLQILVFGFLLALAFLPASVNSQTCTVGGTCGTYLYGGPRPFTCNCYVWQVPPGTQGCCRTQVGCSCEEDCTFYNDCCSDVDNCNVPVVNQITPSSFSSVGNTVLTLTGSKLLNTAGTVTLGSTTLTCNTWSDTSVQCNLIPGSGSDIDVVLTTSSGKTSNTQKFSYDPPSISGISPNGGSTAGSQLVVTGTSFFTSGATIEFDGSDYTGSGNIPSQGHTSITFNVPAGQGVNKVIRVKVGGQTSNAMQYSYGSPTLISLSPNNGPTAGSTSIVISGSNFGVAVPSITIASVPCTYVSHTHTSITCTSPSGKGVNKGLAVTAGGQLSNELPWSYDPPFISSITASAKDTGGGGTLIITGTNFASGGTVTVGDNSCPDTLYTDSEIRCTIPAGEGDTNGVKVQVITQSSNIVNFAYNPPTISGFSPATSATQGGASLVVSGTNFGLTGTIHLSSATCAVTSRSHTSLTCTIPEGQGTGLSVVVNVAGRTATAASTFSYGAPNIDSFSPTSTSTAGGVIMTVSGTNLGNSGTVQVGGQPCQISGTGFTHTQVTCEIPAGVGTGKTVSVSVGGQGDSRGTFNYTAPSITQLIPATGSTAGGIQITLKGTSFGTSGGTVMLGSTACPIVGSTQTHTQIICTLPEGRGSANFVVSVGGQSSAPFLFTYAPPSISSFSPDSGDTQGGATMVINGGSFDSPQGTGTVTIGGVTATVTSWGHSTIQVITPEGVGTGLSVVVRRDDGLTATASTTFDYAPPGITSIDPTSASTDGTETLTITGTNFAKTQAAGSSEVTVGSALCTPITSWSHTKIECRIPPLTSGSGVNKLVQVKVSGVLSSSATFNYDSPTLSSISPNQGETGGGQPLLITGANFGLSATVTVGGVDCPVRGSPTPTHTQLTCTLPSGQGNAKPVVLTAGSQESNTLFFSYFGPTITGLDPLIGPTAGGIPLTITGTSLGTEGTVTVGAQTCPITSHVDTQIICTLPPGEGADRTLQAFVSATTSNTVTFSYSPPTIATVSPGNSDTAGQIPMTVTGHNFGLTGTVRVAGRTCTTSGTHTHTTIVCTVPAGEGANQPVDVIVLGQVSNTTVPFSYNPPSISGILPISASTAGGITVTISGTNLGRSGTVTVGGSPCVATGNGFQHTTITCVLPPGAGQNQVVSADIGGQITTTTFSYLPPSITSVTPSNGPTNGGTQVTVKGSSFGTGSAASVRFGTVVCDVNAAAHTQIICTTRQGQGVNLNTEVTVAGQQGMSTTHRFSYDPPTVTSVSPATGPTNGHTGSAPFLLTIGGQSFDTTGSVNIGTFACPTQSWTFNQIVCRLPEGAGADLPVQVTTTVGPSNTNVQFSYRSPTINSLSPSQGGTDGNTVLTITGTNFYTAGTVTIGGTVCDPQANEWTHEQIKCVVRPGEGVGKIVSVNVAGELSNEGFFNFLPPSLSSVTPTTGPSEGWTASVPVLLSLSGSNFGVNPTVFVSGTPCPLEAGGTHQALTCRLPAGQGFTKQITVSAGGQTSNSLSFAYQAPSISGVSPSTGPTRGGMHLTLTGTSFGISGVVTVGGSVCPPVTYGHQQIVCTLPAGEGINREVKVIVETVSSNPVTFSYGAPVITGVNPLSAASEGGDTITVTGDNFGTSGFVQISGRTCVSTAAVFNHSRITCTLPAGDGNNNPIVVIVGSQTSAQYSTPFSYNAPSVNTINPTGAGTAGGILVSISGSSFGTSGTVTVGGKTCAISGAYSHTAITCVLPEGEGKDLPVIVSSGGQSSSGTPNFSYTVPSVASVTPSSGPTAGGLLVTLTGSNFGTSSNVTIDGQVCSPTAAGQTHGRIVCQTPAGVGINRDVIATVGGQASAPAAFSYTAPLLSSLSTTTPGYTEGGFTLTLFGTNIGAAAGQSTIVLDNGNFPCVVTAATQTNISCTAPAGQGSGKLLFLTVAGSSALNVLQFAYAAPQIDSIQGCTTNGNAATECDIAGGELITLTGHSFGFSNLGQTSVTISTERLPCTDLTFLANHTQLRCRLPAKSSGGAQLPVYVTVAGIEGSANLVSYKGPELIANTLNFVVNPNAQPGNLVVDRSQPGRNPASDDVLVTMQGRNLGSDPSALSLWYSTPSMPDAKIPCYVQSLSGTVTQTVTCILANAAGINLQFRVGVGQQVSAFGTDTLTYQPTPQFVPTTLRLEQDPILTDNLFGLNTEGDYVMFDVLWLGNISSAITVTYGTNGGPYDQICSDVSATTDAAGKTTVTCKTSPGEGGPFVFNVSSVNQYAEVVAARDQYSYPDAPVVHAVRGCSGFDGNKTTDCPTQGQITITVLGEKFAATNSTTSVKIGVDNCPITAFQGSTAIECTLPAGAGFDQSVLVIVGKQFSRAKRLLSYGRPNITTIRGCPTLDGDTTKDCNRFGGDRITLAGQNFGASDAIVVVSGSPCTGVTHSSASPHTSVECTLASGSTKDATVLLIQANGEATDNSGLKTLSYLQCAPGRRDNGSLVCEDCLEGSFTASEGQPVCSQCAAGFYAPGVASTTCLACPVGKFAVQRQVGTDFLGAVQCTSCVMGEFASAVAQTGCKLCGVGEFSNTSAAVTCNICPPGSIASLAGSTKCDQCTAGRFAAAAGSVACALCPPGAISAAGDSTCTQCQKGYYQPSQQGTQCLPCPMGTAIGAVGESGCKPCDAGFFANATALTSCLKCGTGQFSVKASPSVGASACQSCQAGTFNPAEGQSVCLDCSPGTHASSSELSVCTKCEAGKFAVSGKATVCISCNAGEYAPNTGSVSCDRCPSGRYSSNPSSSECSPCAVGTSQIQEGQTSCEPCAAGFAVSSQGAVQCQQCKSGFFSNSTGWTVCELCSAGTVSQLNSVDPTAPGPVTCTPCNNGTVQPGQGQEQCTNCPEGEYAPGPGLASCLVCPAGRSSDSIASQSCEPCSAGRFAASAGSLSCDACPQGSISAGPGAQSCTLCPAGEYQLTTGASYCEACALGRFTESAGSSQQCKVCVIGSFANVTRATACTLCSPGEFQSTPGSFWCNKCPMGKFNTASGSVDCEPCGLGTFGAAEGLTQCQQCPSGKFSATTSSTTCASCVPGFYAAGTGEFGCTAAPQGFHVPTTGANASVACGRGFFQDDVGQSDCKRCQPGKFQNKDKQNSCSSCKIGSYAAFFNMSSCVLCERGRFASAIDSETCTKSPQGSYVPSLGAFVALPCEVGRYGPTQELTSCPQCEVGKFQRQQGQTSCDLCAPGFFTNVEGQDSCSRCPVGFFNNVSGSTGCSPCATGSYMPFEAASVCFQATVGHFVAVTGADSQEQCPKGLYGPTPGRSDCLQCARGFFGPTEARSVCEACGPGTFTSTGGSVTCDPCTPGQYAPGFNYSTCLDCDAGSASGSSSASSCTPCANGTWQANSGQSKCDDCEPGYFTNKPGSDICTGCTKGSAQPSLGGTWCNLCPAGTFADADNTPNCKNCAPGKIAVGLGNTICVDCNKGQFSKDAQSAECSNCTSGRFAENPGQVSCDDCPAGRFSFRPDQNSPLLESCTACPRGYSQLHGGRTSCEPCLPGTFTDDLGQTSCQTCDPGTYAPGSNFTECLRCNEGTFVDVQGAQQCTPCAVGTYAASKETTRCQSCLPGFFNNITGQSRCLACPSGSFQTRSGATGCDLCPIGKSNANIGQEQCAECEAGKFTVRNGSISCNACTPGSYTSGGGSGCLLCETGRFQRASAQSQCESCEPGYYSNTSGLTLCFGCVPGYVQPRSRQTACDACGSGTFQPSPRLLVCDKCEVGKYTGPGAFSECTDCEEGKFQDLSGQDFCRTASPGHFAPIRGLTLELKCESGRFSNTSGALSCLLCPEGRYQREESQTYCLDCETGKAQPNKGKGGCDLCKPGFFGTETKATKCEECTPGKFQELKGQTKCEACPKGTVAPEGAAPFCDPCGLGLYQNETGKTACIGCPAAKYAGTTGSWNCTNCPPGRANSGFQQPVCGNCSAGEFQNMSGQACCQRCDVGTAQSNEGKTRCQQCAPGYFVDQRGSGACNPCAPGRAQTEAGKTFCTECVRGKFSGAGQATCSPCAPGKFTDTSGRFFCQECPLGRYNGLYDQWDCVDCKAGNFSNVTGLTACHLCEPGRATTQDAQANCDLCSVGQYQDVAGQLTCKSCDPGYYSGDEGLSQCLECNVGFFSAQSGTVNCAPCGKGEHTSPSGARTECIKCPVGTAFGSFNNTQSTCPPCANGRVARTTGRFFCEQCEVGRFAATNKVNCTDCGRGTYSPQPGGSECLQCGPGRFADEPKTVQCSPCEAGRIAAGNGSTECSPCSPGWNQPAQGKSFCTACDAGRFSVTNGSALCAFCDKGRFGVGTGKTECETCPPGRHQNELGAEHCTECNVGFYSAARGLVDCLPCPKGRCTAQNGTATNCFPCPLGSHAPNEGATECQFCPTGTYTNQPGQSSCTQCDTGFYQPNTNSTVCVSCELGRFSSFKGADICDLCFAGQAQDTTGQSFCDLCEPGFFQPNRGNTSCLKCGVGQFAVQPGLTTCSPCNPGFFANTNATAQCLPCKKGTYTNRFGTVECDPCPSGTHNPDEDGSTGCLVCEKGKFAQNSSEACKECGARQVAMFEGSSTCAPCDRLSNPDLDTQSVCECIVGYYARDISPQIGITPLDELLAGLCLPCPEGALCREIGLTYSTLPTRRGYWRPNNTTFTWYRCIREFQCLGGFATGDASCESNHEGPACANCKPSYYADARGNCIQCPSQGGAIVSFILLFALVIVVLALIYWILLRSGSELMKEAKRQHQMKKEGLDKFDQYGTNHDPTASRSFFLHEPPPPPPSIEYKLKIALGFIQIMTNLAFSADIPWPSAYKEFISWLNIINFDFIKISSVECVSTMTYFVKFRIVAVTPLGIFFGVAVFYLLPKYLKLGFKDRDSGSGKRSRQRFWRIFTFTLFLIYPTVSSTVLRLYVCKTIEGTNYILADPREQCFTTEWWRNAILGFFMIVLYPIGIPVFLGTMLYVNRNRLSDPGVRAQLGILYDGYYHDRWWFELVDMSHKLFLVAVVAFFPEDWQLQVACLAVISYTILILLKSPYVRKGDDRLHLLANVEIFLLLLSVHVFNNELEQDEVLDILLSIILILLALLFFAYFVPQVATILIKMCVIRFSCCAKCLGRFSKVQNWKSANRDMKKDGILDKHTLAEMQMGSSAIAVGGTTRSAKSGSIGYEDSVRLQRNPIYDELGTGADANAAMGYLGDVQMNENPLAQAGLSPLKPNLPEYSAQISDVFIEETVEIPEQLETHENPLPMPMPMPEDDEGPKFKEEFAMSRPKQKKKNI